MKAMERVPEPEELMLDAEQAKVYGGADLTSFNQTLLTEFQRHFADFRAGRVLDLGCGTADIALRFAGAYPETELLGIDGSAAMLELGQSAVRAQGLEARIALREGYLPLTDLETASFDAVLANSLLHHLADPEDLWRTIRLCARPGAPIMVVDLIRPGDLSEAQSRVEKYAERGHPLVRRDLFNSLCAAYSVENVREQLRQSGLPWMQVEAVSELQMKVWGRAA